MGVDSRGPELVVIRIAKAAEKQRFVPGVPIIGVTVFREKRVVGFVEVVPPYSINISFICILKSMTQQKSIGKENFIMEAYAILMINKFIRAIAAGQVFLLNLF